METDGQVFFSETQYRTCERILVKLPSVHTWRNMFYCKTRDDVYERLGYIFTENKRLRNYTPV